MTRDLSAFEQNLVNAMTDQAHAVEPPRFDAPAIIDTERRRTRRRIGLTVVSVTAAAGIAACVAGSPSGSGRTGPPVLPVIGASGTQTPSASPSTSPPAPPSTPDTRPSAAASAGGSIPAGGAPASAWPTGPTSSPFAGSVPPVPTMVSITPGDHAGYVRVSFEFDGQVPGYAAAYVQSVIGDGSGAKLSVAGKAYLQLKFRSAQSHVHPVERSFDPNSELQGFIVNGDFEGVVTVTLGLAAKHGYHVGVLTKSATDHVIYVDIAQ